MTAARTLCVSKVCDTVYTIAHDKYLLFCNCLVHHCRSTLNNESSLYFPTRVGVSGFVGIELTVNVFIPNRERHAQTYISEFRGGIII